jgi:hypothetical protein
VDQAGPRHVARHQAHDGYLKVGKVVAMKVDPGIGRESAPVGSRAWAERVRLNMQGLVSSVDANPSALRFYVDLVKEHQAWTLMSRDDGSCFRTFEEFCEYRQPWGLGRPWPELRPFIVAACAGNEAQAAAMTSGLAPTLSDAGSKGGEVAGRGRPKAVSDNERPNGPRGATTGYLAARIARDAPEVHEQMKAGAFPSVRAAAIKAGIVKPADPVKVAARELRKASAARPDGCISGDLRGAKLVVRGLTREEQGQLYEWLGKELAS